MSGSAFNLDFALALLRASLFVFGALLFGSAAWSKFADREVFRGVLGAYRILPGGLLESMAVLLPTAEAAAAILLLIPATQPAGARLAGALAGCFAVAIGINVARGRTMIDCGCGGARGRQTVTSGLVLANLLLALVFTSSAQPRSVATGMTGEIIAAAAGTSLYLLYATYRTLSAEWARPVRRISPTLRRLAWTRLPGGVP
jgi:hypothetical protein